MKKIGKISRGKAEKITKTKIKKEFAGEELIVKQTTKGVEIVGSNKSKTKFYNAGFPNYTTKATELKKAAKK